MRLGSGISITAPRRRGGGGGPSYPAKTRWTNISAGMDFQSSISNVPGNYPWFNGSGGPGTFQAVCMNLEPDPIVRVQLVIDSREASSASMIGYAVQVGATWASSTTQVTPAGGGSVASPKLVRTATIDLPAPVAQGQTFRLHVVLGEGIWSAGKSFGGVWPTSNRVTAQNFNSGNHLTDIPGNFVGIGPLQNILWVERTGTAQEWVEQCIIGDSTSVDTRPIASSNNTAKEGIVHYTNVHARSQGWKFRTSTRGQGGATIPEIYDRARANASDMAGRVQIVRPIAWSWNEAPESVAAMNANWALYLALKAELEGAGFICRSLIIHPYTTRNSAGQIAAWNRAAELVAEEGGTNWSDIMGGPAFPSLPAEESQDFIHQDEPGAIRCGPLVAARERTFVQQFYPGV